MNSLNVTHCGPGQARRPDDIVFVATGKYCRLLFNNSLDHLKFERRTRSYVPTVPRFRIP